MWHFVVLRSLKSLAFVYENEGSGDQVIFERLRPKYFPLIYSLLLGVVVSN